MNDNIQMLPNWDLTSWVFVFIWFVGMAFVGWLYYAMAENGKPNPYWIFIYLFALLILSNLRKITGL